MTDKWLPTGIEYFPGYSPEETEYTMAVHEWCHAHPMHNHPETYVAHLFGELWESLGDTAFEDKVHEAFFALQDAVIGEREL